MKNENLRKEMALCFYDKVDELVNQIIWEIHDGMFKYQDEQDIIDYLDSLLYQDDLTFWYDEFLDNKNGCHDDLVIEIARELRKDLSIVDVIDKIEEANEAFKDFNS